jgi:hypothetical protein
MQQNLKRSVNVPNSQNSTTLPSSSAHVIQLIFYSVFMSHNFPEKFSFESDNVGTSSRGIFQSVGSCRNRFSWDLNYGPYHRKLIWGDLECYAHTVLTPSAWNGFCVYIYDNYLDTSMKLDGNFLRSLNISIYVSRPVNKLTDRNACDFFPLKANVM